MMFDQLKRLLVFSIIFIIASPLYAQVEVLTSIRPLGLLAETVVGDRGTVRILLPKGSSAHHYHLRYSDRKSLSDADLVLWIGENLETFLAKPISQRQGLTITANLLPGMQWPAIGPEKAFQHQHHHHLGKNPHSWLNPLNNLVIIDHLVDSLSQLDQMNAEVYRENGKYLKAELRKLDRLLAQKLKAVQTKGFIVNHPAYDHFIEHYGLMQIGVVNQSLESPSGVRHLMALREENNIYCIFGDYGYRSDKSEQLAVDLNTPIAYLDPLGYSLADNASLPLLLKRIGETFYNCLSGVAS